MKPITWFIGIAKISIARTDTPSFTTDMFKGIANAHVILANYGNGGLIENTQPLIYTYTLTFKASAGSWSRVELKTSNDRITYDTEASFILNGTSQLTTLTTAKPYFTIQKVDGEEI